MGGVVTIGEVLMTITADASEVEAGLAEATEATETSTGTMKSLFDGAEKAIGKSMKEAAKHVTEAVGEMVKKFVDAGMGANAAAESIAGGFDKLTGGVLKLEAIVEATDKVKDFVLKLKNLSETVPLSLGKTVELKDAVERLGISSEHLPEILQTLTSNMAKAAAGDADATKKFHELGIATDGWKEKLPGADAILVQLANNIYSSKNPLVEMNKAVEVAGDKFSELTPLVRQGGAAVTAQAESHVANAKAIEGSTSAFQHLHETESNLAEAMQNLLIPIFRVLAQVLDVVLQIITKLIEWFTRFGHAAIEAGRLVADAFKAAGKIIEDIFRPIFGWLKEGLDAVMGKLRELGGWFERMARIGVAAFTEVKNFLVSQLQPVFKAIGEGVDWVVQKFNNLKEWIGRVKNAIFEMARPVIDTFKNIAKEIGDFFHMHWGDVAKDAREAAATLNADVQKIIDAASGNTPVDADHQFGRDPVAQVKSDETKKTDAVKHGAKVREQTEQQSNQNITNNLNSSCNVQAAEYDSTLKGMADDTKKEGKAIGTTLAQTPAPLVPATKKAADQAKKIWQDVAHNIATTFSSAIRGMIDGTQTMAQAFAKMGQQMLSNLESVLEKMLSQWLEHHLMELFIHTQTKQEEVTVDKAASAEKQEIGMKEHISEVFRAAKQAAVNAWKALSGIPVVGPALGAAAASATFAAVMAFGSLTSAAGGFYEVDRDQLALIHKKEMVLPAGIAERLRSTVASGGGLGPDVHVHVYQNVNAIDAASFKDSIKQHGNMIGNEVAKVLKRRRLNPNFG